MIRPPAERRWWWFVHMVNMLSAYIATVSAFSAVNLDLLPPLVQWLWPTAVGTPAIFVWVAYHKRRFASREAASPK